MNIRSIASALLATLFLVGSGFVAYENIESVREHARSVTHAQEVLANINALLATMIDAETGERGYIISGDDSYLQPYNDSLGRLKSEFDHLKALTRDNPTQQANLKEIEPLIEERLGHLREGIDARRTRGVEAASKVIATNLGKKTMDKLRAVAARMIGSENDLLASRSASANDAAFRAYLAIAASTLLGFVLLGAFMYLIMRHLAERSLREREVFNHREWLRVTLSSIGDAVIVTDMHGLVTFVNPVAEKMTGLKSSECIQQPLQKCFNIINEVTRQPAPNPVERVLREGIVVGLANHTALIKPDGSETPIEDSAAPIKDSNGAMIGTIMVFHDVSAERKAARELAKAHDDLGKANAALEQRMYELRERTERLRVTLASIGDAVIVTDTAARVVSLNRVAESLTGWTSDEALKRPLDEVFNIVNEQTRKRADDPARRALREGMIVALANHTLLIAKNGVEYAIDDSAAPIKDENGKVLGVVLVFRDVSERKRIEEDRAELLRREKEARGEAERANRMKDEFLAMVSHELRTPLTPILGWTRMLKSGALGQEHLKKGLDVIERNVNAQTQVIEDLLDVSRIITGKLQLNLVATDLSQIIESAIETVRPAASGKQIQIDTQLDSNHPWVMADPNRLQQVIWNVVGNAIKFTPVNGTIHVKLRVEEKEAVIEVSDNGEGIDASFLPLLFNRFMQADSTIRRSHGGLGLGLAIVRHLVEAHGGTVAAFSDGKGRGAKFTIRLPARATKPPAETPAPAQKGAITSSTLNGLNVLVLEDDTDSLEFIAVALEQGGAAVTRSESVAEALERFDQRKPDVIVSDIGLPQEDGYSFIRKIRQRPKDTGGLVPAIALTAFAKADDRINALTAGFQMHVAKPIEPAELMAAVAALAGRKLEV